MPTGTPIAGAGARLFYTLLDQATGAPSGSAVEVFEATILTAPGEDVSSDDTTPLNGSTNNTATFLPIKVDPGMIEFEVNFVPSNAVHQELIDLCDTKQYCGWSIAWGDGTDGEDGDDTEWNADSGFNVGFIQSWKPGQSDTDKKQSMRFTVKMSGERQFA